LLEALIFCEFLEIELFLVIVIKLAFIRHRAALYPAVMQTNLGGNLYGKAFPIF